MNDAADPTLPIILVVDDAPENITVLKRVLGGTYLIRPAINGKAALKAVTVEPMPDLILLDVMMPDMDGYEVCQQLKKDPRTREIPVIFVTGKNQEEDELWGLTLGAVDYITKPFSPAIVRARLKTHLALRCATRKLDRHNQLLMDERELIENIILKMRLEDGFDDRYLRSIVSPVETTAGDMLLSTFTPDGRQLVLLGDFTGHGLIAAIGGPLVGYIFQQMAGTGARGAQILAELNHQLCVRMPVGVFLAAILLEITPERTGATLWNAALPNALLMRDGAIRERFPSGLLALGIVRELEISGAATPIHLETGDRLYLLTDGIIEARGRHEEMFGLQRLETFLLQMANGVHDLRELLPRLERHVGSSNFKDDVTLAEVRMGSSATPMLNKG
ncbi:MAG: SpoIIE family protein phosphatase [Magnetococcales bacterium]|nr:SpoIIE family protein phosphatase [Magnetococcales bacterium]